MPSGTGSRRVSVAGLPFDDTSEKTQKPLLARMRRFGARQCPTSRLNDAGRLRPMELHYIEAFVLPLPHYSAEVARLFGASP